MADAQRANGFDPTLTRRYVSDIDRHLDTLDSYTGEHMQRCKSVRDLISEVYDRAKDSGIPKKELKAVVKARVLERKAKKVRDDLDDFERQETFDQIRLALGDLADTPLGKAATGEPDDGEHEDESDAQASANKDMLGKGIKPMRKNRGAKNGRPDEAPSNGAALDDLTEKASGAGDFETDVRPTFLQTGGIAH